jgi:hypothetical protein
LPNPGEKNEPQNDKSDQPQNDGDYTGRPLPWQPRQFDVP